MNNVPAGFRRLQPMDAVMGGFAPVYVRRSDAGMTLGFHIGPQHCNPRGVCHGGTWSTMADVLMGLTLGLVTGMAGPTVSLSLDFLGAAQTGQWVEGGARLLRSSPRLGFLDCLFTAGGEAVLRGSAVFRRKAAFARDIDDLFAGDD